MSIIFACGIVEVTVVNHKERTKKLLRKRGEIAANYLRGWFIIDLVSIFPVEIVAMLIEAQAETKATAEQAHPLDLPTPALSRSPPRDGESGGERRAHLARVLGRSPRRRSR